MPRIKAAVCHDGPDAKGVKVGDKVVATLIWACGSCPACDVAQPTKCQTPYDGDKGPITTIEGGKLHHGLACGAFAERIVVDESQVVVLPDGISMEAASLLACGVITGIGAVVNGAQIRPGQDVVVIGAGGVGLNTIQGAAISGARRIVAVDMELLAAARMQYLSPWGSPVFTPTPRAMLVWAARLLWWACHHQAHSASMRPRQSRTTDRLSLGRAWATE